MYSSGAWRLRQWSKLLASIRQIGDGSLPSRQHSGIDHVQNRWNGKTPDHRPTYRAKQPRAGNAIRSRQSGDIPLRRWVEATVAEGLAEKHADVLDSEELAEWHTMATIGIRDLFRPLDLDSMFEFHDGERGRV